MNCILCFVLYCILLSAFVGLYTEYEKVQGMSNLKCMYVCMYIIQVSFVCQSTKTKLTTRSRVFVLLRVQHPYTARLH
jgi:hypothetical protein